MNLLGDLTPPFFLIENESFVVSQSRHWFSIELALLSVYYLYRLQNISIHTPLLLDQETIKKLCPLCLADASTITTLIDIASKTYPYLDIHTGEWGTSVILQKEINLSMLI